MSSVNSEVAYEYIRKKILNGEFAPGQPLMTLNLAAEIRVSRTPVRDALRQLEADGLVTIRPRLGASVRAMDMKEFRELCGLRLALESFASGLAAAHRNEEDLHEMRYALDAMAALTAKVAHAPRQETTLHAELVREDIRFHIAIMAAAKNTLMKKEILRLHLINRVVSGPLPSAGDGDFGARQARRQEVIACHQAIYEAIERREVVAAKQAMEHHIQDIIDHNLRRLVRADTGTIAKELTEEELSYSA